MAGEGGGGRYCYYHVFLCATHPLYIRWWELIEQGERSRQEA